MEELIRKAAAGDREAMEELLEQNYKILKGYLIKLTFNESLAEDLTQETMVKAIININRFKPKAKFSTWLISIASNLYKDYLKKNKNHVVLDEKCSLLSSLSPQEEIMTNITVSEVMNELAQLPYEKRAVVILKHYYGFRYEEIAKILKCPIGTVRSRLHNSIELIREKLV